MKKMRNSKRGFTLTELIVVVAIVVIVASAAFVGVAITLENAKRQQDLINDTHGRDPTGKDLFEKDAWVEIDKWTKNAAQLLDIHYHTPSSGEDSGSATPTPTPGTDGGSSSVTNTPTPKATATPTTASTNTPTPTPTTTTGSKPSNISNLPGSVSTGDASVATASVGSPADWGSVQAYDCSVSSGNGSCVYSVVIKVSGTNPKIDNPNHKYTVYEEGNGEFRITYTKNDASNLPYDSPTFRVQTKTGSGCKVTVKSIDYYI